jgi:hypothetical protein
MPKVLDKTVKALEKKGMGKSRAFAIATATQQKAGNLKPGTNKPTKKGRR